MALRLIQLFLPIGKRKDVEKFLSEEQIVEVIYQEISEDRILVKILAEVEKTEALIDHLEKKFSGNYGYRVIVQTAEATLPRPEKEETGKKDVERISREELYTALSYATKPTKQYVFMVALSAVVAAIGLMKGDVAIIIGAMVLAPLLGPNVALSLATTLGDTDLAKKALKANALGIFTALLLSVLMGLFLAVNPNNPSLLSRTDVGFEIVILALVSGSAGVVAFTSAVPAALVGVMVAVALLPPIVALGLFLGSGNIDLAYKAGLMVLTNLIGINLAGVATFLAQGIRPVTWWEKEKAKKASRLALTTWAVLLAILTILVYLAQGH